MRQRMTENKGQEMVEKGFYKFIYGVHTEYGTWVKIRQLL